MPIRNRASFIVLRACFDYALFFASYPIAFAIRFSILPTHVVVDVPFERYFFHFFLLSHVFLFVLYMLRLYDQNHGFTSYHETARLFLAHMISLFILLFYLYLIKDLDVSRVFILIFFGVCFLLLTSTRLLMAAVWPKLVGHEFLQTNVLLVGTDELAYEYYRTVSNGAYGIRVHRIISDEPVISHAMPVDGTLEDLPDILYGNQTIEQVVISDRLIKHDAVARMIDLCEDFGIKSSILPAYQQYCPSNPYHEQIGSLVLADTRTIPLDQPINRLIKRLIDVIGSLTLILIFSPILLLITVLIACTSKGPILFRQNRVGYNQREFSMVKFRSMVEQTPKEEQKHWSKRNDPRVTGIGRLIRTTGLDELPQLFHVLFGNMSLVGPRPERKQFVQKFSKTVQKYNLKHRVKPGITGLAQIRGYRGDTSLERRIEYDLIYIEQWSLQMEIYILVRTLFFGFFNAAEKAKQKENTGDGDR